MSNKDLTISDVRDVLNKEIEIAFSTDSQGGRKRIVFNGFQHVYRIYVGGTVVMRFGGSKIDEAVDYYNSL